MGGARRAENAVEPVAARAADPLTGKPGAHLAFERRRRRLARQQLVGKPSPQPRFGPLVETGDREAVENKPPMPAASPPGPFVIFQHFDADADLGCQMPDDRRSKIGLIVGKATTPPPVHELNSKPELASVGQPRQPGQILSPESPALLKLLYRPQPLHRSAPISSVQTTAPPSVRSSQLGHFAQLCGHWAQKDVAPSRERRYDKGAVMPVGCPVSVF